jgi:zinc protease
MALLVGLLAAPAGAAAPKLPVTTFSLKNGLTVIVQEDHTVPIVAVEVYYRVGSKEEKPGKTGFAHLFEHLMFKGSAHVADGEHFKYITEAGGWNNATTNTDRTNYFEVVPSNFLSRALWLESDRMGFMLDGITQDKLDNQRDVVRNERRQNYENRPYGMAPRAIHEALYPETHPYHWLTIGEHADLEKASLDDVKEFFRTWYTPANASLAIVGDVKVAEARKLAEQYFGDLPSHQPPKHAEADPVALAQDKRVHLDDKVSLERLYYTWPSPAAYAAGDAELDLLATVLGSKSGRLYKRLVYETQVAQSVEVGQGSQRLGSTFGIWVTAKPGHNASELEKLVDEEIAALLGPRPVTEAELARAKNAWEASFVYALQGFGGFGGRSARLSDYLAFTGRADYLDKDLQRYYDATPASVAKEAKEVLSKHKVILTVTPKADVQAAKPGSGAGKAGLQGAGPGSSGGKAGLQGAGPGSSGGKAGLQGAAPPSGGEKGGVR